MLDADGLSVARRQSEYPIHPIVVPTFRVAGIPPKIARIRLRASDVNAPGSLLARYVQSRLDGGIGMRNLMLVVCLFAVLSMCVSGCGSANASENVTMQGGQWEYVVTPENSGITMYFGTNLPMTSASFNTNNTVIFQPSQVSSTQNVEPIVCSTYALNGAIDGTKIDGKFDTPTAAFASFSGQLSSNGQSISNGKYDGEACAIASTAKIKGTLTGYTVAPISGTFTGKLTSSSFGADVMTIAFTQNSDFSLNFSGTSVENGVTTSFTNMTGATESFIVGGTVLFGANTVNVNGKSQFSGMGHLSPDEKQLLLRIDGPNDSAVGTLTKR
jgi:hypothetical protein